VLESSCYSIESSVENFGPEKDCTFQGRWMNTNTLIMLVKSTRILNNWVHVPLGNSNSIYYGMFLLYLSVSFSIHDKLTTWCNMWWQTLSLPLKLY